MNNVLPRPQEVAQRLQILQKMRVQGTGPKFIKLADGKNAAVRHHEVDVDDYIASRLRRDSSSSETIRRWCREFRKIADAPPKGRNSVIIGGYRHATHAWTIYRAAKDVEEAKPYFGEEAATFILSQIILTTRDTRDPEETYEGE